MLVCLTTTLAPILTPSARTYIQVPNPDPSAAGGSEEFRLVTLTGDESQIAEFEKRILQIVSEKGGDGGGGRSGRGDHGNNSNSSGPRKEIVVPSSCVGLIIGRGGATIKQWQEEVGGRINVGRDAVRRHGGARFVGKDISLRTGGYVAYVSCSMIACSLCWFA